MAATTNGRGGLGWVILVIALAVPGVLFYNWWSHLKAEREKAVAAKARGRVPDGGVFQASPAARLVNPSSPVVSTTTAGASAAPAADAAHPAPVSAVPVSVSAAPNGAVPPGAAVSAPPVAAVSTAAPGAGTVAAPAFSSSTATAAPLKRDPTLSPFDQLRMIEEEEAKRRAAEDLENMKRPKAGPGRKKAVVRDPATMVNLQGIISNTESGYKAIVNDEVLSAGEMIGTTKIKIIKITDLGVTFQYQGKRFSKGVSRD